ncbi:urate oxidase [Micromonospora sp. KC606]|nr:urate oxidase [Micromonospora sp. KC606]
MGTSLSFNQYGKAENRVVRIYRDTPRHEIWDLDVSTALRGDFAAAHIEGDQCDVLPTDTQKNTAFAYAKKHGVTSVEDYAIAVGRRLIEATPKASGVQVRVEQYAWDRIDVGGAGHDHAFLRRGGAVRTSAVTLSGRDADQQIQVVSGLRDLVLLKSTRSEFKGFLTDDYTTLQETDDRILATSLVARWRYAGTDVDWNAAYGTISASLLETFATTYSRALQETLYLMGEQVLKARGEVAEIRFSAPNRHHFLVDLAPFGLENNGEVFIGADRPYGLIETTVARDDAPDAGDAWLAVPSFL